MRLWVTVISTIRSDKGVIAVLDNQSCRYYLVCTLFAWRQLRLARSSCLFDTGSSFSDDANPNTSIEYGHSTSKPFPGRLQVWANWPLNWLCGGYTWDRKGSLCARESFKESFAVKARHTIFLANSLHQPGLQTPARVQGTWSIKPWRLIGDSFTISTLWIVQWSRTISPHLGYCKVPWGWSIVLSTHSHRVTIAITTIFRPKPRSKDNESPCKKTMTMFPKLLLSSSVRQERSELTHEFRSPAVDH